jgi:type I restriction enzyme S subunit
MIAETNSLAKFGILEIPDGWQIKKLKDILIEGRLGGNYENAEANNGIPVIKMGNLDRATIKIDKIQYLPENEIYNDEDVLIKGDLLFNTRNTLELVGKVAIWNNELPFAVYNSNLMRMKFDNAYVESTWFMNRAFNSYYGLRQLRGIATGTTSVAAIYGRDLESIKFLLPPLPEQKAIAQVFSTADAAIHTTEKIIAQKVLRNKWLMQQLLSGKKRLNGFENTKWKIQPLENFIKPIVREVPKPSTPYLGIGLRSHGKGTFLKHDEQPEKNSMDNFYVVRPNDLIVNITFAWEQAIAIVRPEDDGALASHRFPTYTFIEDKGHPDFFRFYILQPRMKFMLQMISPGGAGRNRVMSKSDFVKLEFLLPDYKEQTAIAQVLQAADKEISLLKAKAGKLREQKKGLMQVLLTGKVRLKIN